MKNYIQFIALITCLSLLMLYSREANATDPLKNDEKVLIVVSSDKHGYWLPEVIEPYQLLKKAGYIIDIASPKGGEGRPRGQIQLSKTQWDWFKQSTLKDTLNNSMKLSSVKSQEYSAVYFAGGAGPMFDMPNNEWVQRIVRDIYEAGGVISADCHGPAAFINVVLSDGSLLVKNKRITAKANIEEGSWAKKNYPFLLENKFKEIGALYSAASKGASHVVVDQRIITGQNPASAIPMTNALIALLKSQN